MPGSAQCSVGSVWAAPRRCAWCSVCRQRVGSTVCTGRAPHSPPVQAARAPCCQCPSSWQPPPAPPAAQSHSQRPAPSCCPAGWHCLQASAPCGSGPGSRGAGLGARAAPSCRQGPMAAVGAGLGAGWGAGSRVALGSVGIPGQPVGWSWGLAQGVPLGAPQQHCRYAGGYRLGRGVCVSCPAMGAWRTL